MEDNQVLDVGSDGSFDASELKSTLINAMENAKRLKSKGNECFARKEFDAACSFYSQAIEIDSTNHILYSNRSTAYFHLKRYELALDDAERAIQLRPEWIKGFARKAAACEALKQFDKALTCHQKILCQEPANVESRRAQMRLRKRLEPHYSNTNNSASALPRGFLHQPNSKRKGLGLYDEKDTLDATQQHDPVERKWRAMLQKLQENCRLGGKTAQGQPVVLQNGLFERLLDPKEFQKLIYPGIPPDKLVSAPKTLQEILSDPIYEQELLQLMPKVQEKANKVLENVKAKGAQQGEVMDQTTETMLMPQILQEAFGREVLAMIQRVNDQKHVLLAQDARTTADPQSEYATWDQIPEDSMVLELFDPARGFAVCEGFMGSDWLELVHSDLKRMDKNNLLLKITNRNEHLIPKHLSGMNSSTPTGGISEGRLCFVDKQESAVQFPALSELIGKLHALPFELNGKRCQGEKLELCAPFAFSTAVSHFNTGEGQLRRLDGGFGAKENGIKVTFIYCANPQKQGVRGAAEDDGETAGSIVLERIDAMAANQPVVLQPRADRLVMFQSHLFYNHIEPARDDLFFVTFWCHGSYVET